MRGIVSENPLAVNALTGPKNSWNLEKNPFILLVHHSEPNWVRKSYFYSYLRFQDCLLTRWSPNTGIFLVIKRIYRYQFKWNYQKNRNFLRHFLWHFRIYVQFPMFWKKHEPHRSSSFEVIDSEIYADLNA